MKALLFGGSGMIGQGVLRELLQRDDVTEVVSLGRSPLPQRHAKLRNLTVSDLVHPEPAAKSAAAAEGAASERWSPSAYEGVDAVFFCLGVSSSGMSEADYRAITCDLPLAIAQALVKTSPGLTFCFVSGAGTNAKSSTMWARVKGEAELALQQVGFRAVYCFRPGYIQPMDGITSKTPAYRWMYRFTAPLYPLFKGAKKFVTTTRQLAFAMVEVAKRGHATPILDSAAINSITAP